MTKMKHVKKVIYSLLAALLVFQAVPFVVFADSPEEQGEIDTIYIKNIDSCLQAGECPLFDSVVVSEDGVTVSKCVTIEDERWNDNSDPDKSLTEEGEETAEPGASYCYQLTLKTNGQLRFSNHLVCVYQGVDVDYALDYEMIDDDHHTMVVTGIFDNVIPKTGVIDKIDLDQILSFLKEKRIPPSAEINPDVFPSDDGSLSEAVDVENETIVKEDRDGAYRYSLVLKTNEGFTFSNNFKFLFRGANVDYSLDYAYALSDDYHRLRITMLVDENLAFSYLHLQPGWQEIGGDTYFINDNGESLTGWQYLGHNWYLFDDEGRLLKGWQNYEGEWYYLDPVDGALQTGWVNDNGTWYYLDITGIMLCNEWRDGYWLSADGAWTYDAIGSWKQDAKGWWFGDTSGWFARNETVRINGVNYKFNADGYWVK